MKQYDIKIQTLGKLFLAVLMLAILPVRLQANPTSANYSLPWASFDAGAVNVASPSYKMLGSIGQTSVVGISNSASYQVSSGFFSIPDSDEDSYIDFLDNCVAAFNPMQRDTDSDNIGNMCDADFNNNCIVDASDFTFLKSNVFTLDQDADLNGNGIVDAADFTYVKTHIFQIPGPSGYAVCGQ